MKVEPWFGGGLNQIRSHLHVLTQCPVLMCDTVGSAAERGVGKSLRTIPNTFKREWKTDPFVCGITQVGSLGAKGHDQVGDTGSGARGDERLRARGFLSCLLRLMGPPADG